MHEKLCLQWNDFQQNIKSAFGNLREDRDFKDVTLVCEDGQQVEAHKVILASSSPTFQKLLGRNKHPHPLMRGMKFEDILAILDFLYFGEANVFQEKLDSFLSIAEELQLKGLLGNTGQGGEGLHADEKHAPPQDFPSLNGDLKLPRASFKRKTSENSSFKTIKAEDDTALAIPSSYSGDVEL